MLREVDVAGDDDLVDHSLQAELLSVLGREDPRDAVVVKLLDLGGHDHAAAAAEHLDVGAAALAQQVQHVLEELEVPALVGRDRDAVRVLGQRAVDDLLDRAVVPEVDHLAAARLQDPPHDVDRRVVPVEQRRRRDEANLVDRLVGERRTARVVHREAPPAIRPPVAPGDAKLTPRPVGPREPPTLHDVYVNVNLSFTEAPTPPVGPARNPSRGSEPGRVLRVHDPPGAGLYSAASRVSAIASKTYMTSILRPLARFLVTSLAFVAVTAVAALPPGVTQGPSVEGITQYTLANGLTVLLFPDASAAKTTVNVTYLVGSRQENYGETGMAHLLEHMLFKGTPAMADPKAELTKRGMRFNASTWYDRTNYHETFNASPADLQWALAMEADRMVNAKVARADLDSEMTVVRNEMEMGENNPWNMLVQRLTGTAYDWHNYGKDTIGARSDVEGVDIGRLQAYYRTYYQPDNAVLVVAGRFDPDEALGWIAKDFGAIPKPVRPLPRLYTDEPVQDGERSVSIRRVGDTQLLGILYHTVPGAHPDAVAVDALAKVMTIEPAGRLYKALVETKKAAGVQSFAPELHDPGFVAFFAQLALTDSMAAARAAMEATLEGVRQDADHGGRGRSRSREGAARLRRDDRGPRAARRRAVRIGRARRLAALLSHARPMAHAHRGRRAARGGRVSQAVEPDGRHVRA